MGSKEIQYAYLFFSLLVSYQKGTQETIFRKQNQIWLGSNVKSQLSHYCIAIRHRTWDFASFRFLRTLKEPSTWFFVEKGQYTEHIMVTAFKSEQKEQKNFKSPLKVDVKSLVLTATVLRSEWGFESVILSQGLSHQEWSGPFMDS